jgi:hypothetical protein
MSRWKAAGIHLSLSVTIGLIVGALLFGVWYPPPYFHAVGADVLVLLLVGVDVVLGPVLTLVVFKAGKRGLKLDLAIIAIVQSIALVYGLSVVLESRPVFLVAATDRFVLVSAQDLDPADLAKGTRPEFRTLSWTGPRTVGAKGPQTGEAANDLLFSGLAGKDIERFPQYYVDYADVTSDILRKARPVADIRRDASVDDATQLDDAVRRSGVSPDTLVGVPLQTRRGFLLMLLDGASGKPMRAVAVDPWEK